MIEDDLTDVWNDDNYKNTIMHFLNRARRRSYKLVSPEKKKKTSSHVNVEDKMNPEHEVSLETYGYINEEELREHLNSIYSRRLEKGQLRPLQISNFFNKKEN